MTKQIMQKFFDITHKGLQTNTIVQKQDIKKKVHEFKKDIDTKKFHLLSFQFKYFHTIVKFWLEIIFYTTFHIKYG